MAVGFPSIAHKFSFLSPPLLGRFVFLRIPPKLSSLRKMSTIKRGCFTIYKDPVMDAEILNDSCIDSGDSFMVGTIRVPLMNQHLQNMQSSSPSSSGRCNSDTENWSDYRSISDPAPSSLPNAQSKTTQIHRRTRVDLGSKNFSVATHGVCNYSSSSENNGLSHTKKRWPASLNKPHSRQGNLDYSPANDKSDSWASFPKFDICRWGRVNDALLGGSLLSRNKECCTEMQGVMEKKILRPGMVLLRHYISLDEQAEIVRSCRKLGLGPGGFYQPGYETGAKLRLQMMCLGLDWDPQTYRYGKKRAIDGSEPPSIPDKFSMLVKGAMQEAQSLIKKETRVSNAEDILPSIDPDVCIVNFYSTNGRLGLHQDRDESKESLKKGLPVVSFSIGDSAEFLYGDERNVEKAEKVFLESGDVLIFGGESRHVFHGVSAIIPNSAPTPLMRHTQLRPGRLNLTFRQF